MTRKHLKSLADALGTVLAQRGMPVTEVEQVALEVVALMRKDAGVVTPHYDRERFSRAVFGSAQVVEMLRSIAQQPTR